ncbi:MAG: carboxypeptidase regulatory-like domain-containing protein [Acidobacteriota bacterium]
MRSKSNRMSLVIGLMGLLTSIPLFGQATATINGRIVDPSGSAIAGASIEAVNDATKFTRRTESNLSGLFVLEALPVGQYTVIARVPGFKVFIQQGITLQVNQRAALDITVELGSVSEEVKVEANVTNVDTVSGTLREVVDTRRIEGLPLNGRNPLQLQALLPGVVSGGSVEHVGGLPGYSINGGISTSNNYFLDGGSFIDPYFNAPQYFPNPDALQEFTIQTNSSSAEYGRNRSGVIAAVTRSGTNQIHGGLFEFLRNNHLNARNFFANKVSPYHQNQFGAYLGGPVLRNKLFYFGSWESYRQSGTPGVSTITTLSAEERRGNFSKLGSPIMDPTTGQPFPGNIIPPDRLSSVNAKWLETYLPLPNGPSNTYTTSLKPGRNRDQYLGKVDWTASEKDRISGRYIQTDDEIVCASVLPGWCRGGPYPRKSFTANYDRTISATSLNNLVFTYNKTKFDLDTTLRFHWKDLGANIPVPSDGYTTTLWVGGRFFVETDFTFIHSRDSFEVSDSYSTVKGNHFLKLGGQISRHRTDLFNAFLSGGGLSYSGQYTGDGAADFVMGRLSYFQQTSLLRNALRQNGLAFYVQDDWKVTPRLTLNLGLRWDPWMGMSDRDNLLAAFRPGQQSTIYPNALQGMVYPGDAGIPNTITGNDLNNFAPRVGFAFTPTGSNRFAIRGGYGIYFDHIRSISLNRFAQVQPFVLDVAVLDVDIADPFGGKSPFPYTVPKSDADRKAKSFVRPTSFTSFNPNFVAPYSQQWNLNIQFEPVRDYTVTAAYVGSKSSKLFMSRNINAPRPRPDASRANIQARRPFQDFIILEEEATDGYSQYHSMQLSLNKRFSRGFTILSSYTWAKNLGLTSPQTEGSQGPRNPLNYNLDKARMGIDVAHRFVGSFVWRLPGEATFQNSPLRFLLAGWETSGIVTLQSGTPFSVYSGVDNSYFGIGADTADLIGNPKLDTGRPRKELLARYFNTDAFTRNAPGTVGTAGLNILDAPGIATVDFGLNKDFQIHESHTIQFRSEFFNLFNRVNLGGPNTTQNSVNFGKIFSARDPRVIQFGLKYRF